MAMITRSGMAAATRLRSGVLALCAFATAAALLHGCAAAPLATVGAAASVGKSGLSVFRAGKLDAVEMASLEAMREASFKAVEDLSLNITRVRKDDENELNLSTRDDLNNFVGIYLLARTETMTRVRIDVGLFGSEAVARLVLRRINAALVGAGHLRAADLGS